MKKFLTTMAVALAFVAADSPVIAQKSKILQPTVKINVNPMTFSEARSFSEGRGAWIEWKTENESKNLGLYVYRINGGERELISPSLIAGANLQTRDEKTTSGTYSFFDRDGDTNSVYAVESYSIYGQKRLSDSIQTLYISDLRTVAGYSSEEIRKAFTMLG